MNDKIKVDSFTEMKWLIDMKNNTPDDYKRFLKDLEMVTGDLLNVLKGCAERL